MNTVEKNTNKSKVKYLTYKDIEKMYISVRHPLKGKNIITYSYKYKNEQSIARRISEVDNQPLDVIVDKLLQLPDRYVSLLENFTNLFNKSNPNRYKLLNRLVDICENDITCEYYNSKDPKVQHMDLDKSGGNTDLKRELLQKSYNIFKRLENREAILNAMFNNEIRDYTYEHEYEYEINNYESSYSRETIKKSEYIDMFVTNCLLNERELLRFLRDFLERKEYPEYKEIVKRFYPNLKNNGR
ncbi:hypothetical protein HDR59_03930 [bacterium]|nr:hypothetical protein [bacterium]